jgi:predicted metal-dependent phosphoesterase TrpH
LSRLADLHLHTIFSDGTFSPEQLVEQSNIAGLCCIAVTDHDCISGIKPTKQAAGDSLEVIPGIELTAELDSNEIHILGYFIDGESAVFKAELDKIIEIRIKRVYEILDKLKALNVDLQPQDVFGIAGQGSVGRLHIARAMVNKGIISNIYEAFSKYIGNKGPAYVGKFSLTPQAAIKLILEARGVPVLAHPGLKGLEVYYPEYSEIVTDYYLQVAAKYDLLVTGGSDCHGDAKPDVKVGKVSIPYELVEKIKEQRDG